MHEGNKLSVFHSNEFIETTVCDKASIVDEWLQNLNLSHGDAKKLIVGLDCKFMSHPIRSMSGKVATLQLCLGNKCLLLQLLYMDYIPQSIRIFLADPNITFVGIDIDHNTQKLRREYDLVCRKKIDVRSLAKTWFPISCARSPSLRGLAGELAGLGVPKRVNPYKCDWESRVLCKTLIDHAVFDAYASYRIAQKLLFS